MPIIDIDDRASNLSEQVDRSAVLDARDKEHGGMRSLPIELENEAKKRSMAGWDGYSTSVTATEAMAAASGEPIKDDRSLAMKSISVGRLCMDVRRAASRWAKVASDDDRELLTTDATLLLLQWPEHGSDPSDPYPIAERIDLGGRQALRLAKLRADRESTSARSALKWIAELERIARGTLPLRAVWLDTERRDRDGLPMCTRPALRALHAAIKQAMTSRLWRAELAERKLAPPVGGMIDIDELMTLDGAESAPARIPDGAAPEVIADLLALPLDAGRAIVAQCEALGHQSGALRAQWGMSEQSYPVALSRGKKTLRDRYPEQSDLMAAISDLPTLYRERCEREAIQTLIAYRDGYAERSDAQTIIGDWGSACSMLPEASRAHLAAARAAIRRNGGQYGSERAERIAASAERLLPAERAKLYRHGRTRQTGELASSYPMAAERRAEISPERRAEIIHARERLDALLEKGSSDAQTLRALREALSAPVRTLRPAPTDESAPSASAPTEKLKRPLEVWPVLRIERADREVRTPIITDPEERAKHAAVGAKLRAASERALGACCGLSAEQCAGRQG